MELLLCRITYPKMRAIGFTEFLNHPHRLQKCCFEKNAFKVLISSFQIFNFKVLISYKKCILTGIRYA